MDRDHFDTLAFPLDCKINWVGLSYLGLGLSYLSSNVGIQCSYRFTIGWDANIIVQ